MEERYSPIAIPFSCVGNHLLMTETDPMLIGPSASPSSARAHLSCSPEFARPMISVATDVKKIESA